MSVLKPGNLTLDGLVQGSDYSIDIEITDAAGTPIADLTGATVAAQVRSDYAASSPLFSFTGSVADGPNATVRNLPATAAQVRLGVWDLDVTLDGVTTTYLYGDVQMLREVTK